MTDLEKLLPGPCALCGETNYPLSQGGPSVCPACDAGTPLKERLCFLREQLAIERKEIFNLRSRLHAAEEQARLINERAKEARVSLREYVLATEKRIIWERAMRMKYVFYLDHVHSHEASCDGDPRHSWTDNQWREAARQALAEENSE